MKVKVYNWKNEATGDIELSKDIFYRVWNSDLVHQVLVSKDANRRHPWSHTKERGEVKGGGKKPWRQKGTGRARHGSIRSPLWRGGGVTFGPSKDRNYTKKINKKMLKVALYCALSKKLADGELKIMESLKTKTSKTKELANNLKTLQSNNTLLIASLDNTTINRVCSNIPKTKCLRADALNITDILKYKNVLIDKEAVNVIK